MPLHMQIGWLVTAVCAGIASQGAREFFTKVPRFFSALALFALALVMLLPYYGGTIRSPLLPGFGSFLLVHAGGLVRAEARYRQSGNNVVGVDLLSQLALLMLLPLAIPSVPLDMDWLLTRAQMQLVAGTVLGAIGYVALLLGVRPLASEAPKAYRVMFGIIVVYTTLELTFLALRLLDREPGMAMEAPIAYGFAVAKILLTLVFSYILIRYVDPNISLRAIALRYVGLRPHE